MSTTGQLKVFADLERAAAQQMRRGRQIEDIKMCRLFIVWLVRRKIKEAREEAKR